MFQNCVAIVEGAKPGIKTSIAGTRSKRAQVRLQPSSVSCDRDPRAPFPVHALTVMKGEQPDPDSSASRAAIDLYWLPLGAGGHSVRLNGRVYEAVAAGLARRPVCDLYHSALEVWVPEGRFVIEQAPIRASDGADRGVVVEGAVGSRWAGRMRIFRYELRCWRDGVILWGAKTLITQPEMANLQAKRNSRHPQVLLGALRAAQRPSTAACASARVRRRRARGRVGCQK